MSSVLKLGITVVALAVIVACSNLGPLPEQRQSRLFDLANYQSVQTRPGQDPELVVAVAISGGGYRAANFALGAMLGMEQVKLPGGSNLLSEVDYFATASGGGIAAGFYVASLLNESREGASAFKLCGVLGECRSDAEDRRDTLLQNQLATLVRGAIDPRALFGEMTRGDFLQRELDRNLLATKHDDRSCWRELDATTRHLSLGHIFPAKGTPCSPQWITIATIYRNGQIFAFTPDVFRARGVTGYRHFSEERRVDPATPASVIPLALGLRSSMNFPGAIPATVLEVEGTAAGDDRFIRLNDGGQADNLALFAALEALNFERSQDRARPNHPPRRQLLVIIDAYNGATTEVGRLSRPPLAVESALRSLVLPMDAYRNRVRADLTANDAQRLSLVSGISSDQDIAVAYIDMSSATSREVGTTLWMNSDTQDLLIREGRDAALSALGDSSVVLFNDTSKAQIRGSRLSTLHRSVEELAKHLRNHRGDLLDRLIVGVTNADIESLDTAWRRSQPPVRQPPTNRGIYSDAHELDHLQEAIAAHVSRLEGAVESFTSVTSQEYEISWRENFVDHANGSLSELQQACALLYCGDTSGRVFESDVDGAEDALERAFKESRSAEEVIDTGDAWKLDPPYKSVPALRGDLFEGHEYQDLRVALSTIRTLLANRFNAALREHSSQLRQDLAAANIDLPPTRDPLATARKTEAYRELVELGSSVDAIRKELLPMSDLARITSSSAAEECESLRRTREMSTDVLARLERFAGKLSAPDEALLRLSAEDRSSVNDLLFTLRLELVKLVGIVSAASADAEESWPDMRLRDSESVVAFLESTFPHSSASGCAGHGSTE